MHESNESPNLSIVLAVPRPRQYESVFLKAAVFKRKKKFVVDFEVIQTQYEEKTRGYT
ncbi:hypothetical protein Back11_41520 [Paenibacillus baekrokdamisoli]|uniref:Uncharacterized protein n=1 Tax=Paenibacillus baekrokdamisoli TaxID=1712516 RepID=A0A3G9IVF0_9BACL|nr:hypothetical protein Back11_41520 [Paenibacillus baekrokdamisoli]